MPEGNPTLAGASATLTLTGQALDREVLSPAALNFLSELGRRFEPRRRSLLEARAARQRELDSGRLPDFPEETAPIRDAEWRVAEPPDELLDRRVEITGPVDRKLIINALNSGAQVFMADFEDSTTPTWANLIAGQRNLMDAVAGTIRFEGEDGRTYELDPEPAVLMVRPRGLHLPERHLRLDGVPLGGALIDLGLFLYHNAKRLLERGSGPYLYLPKIEHYLEARWWNELIGATEELLKLPQGATRVTVLIETLPAAFQMDEILHELRTRALGLNCGRWDYIFSYIKTLHAHPDRLLPDREQVTMQAGFLRAYSQRLIHVCHRRGAFAMGGMAAQIPIRADHDANERALAKVRADKEREARDGHDGTWVAHPGLVPIAREVFDRVMPGPNQRGRQLTSPLPEREALLTPIPGEITEAGVRGNIEVALRYLSAWLAGRGCVPIHHLMEDAATAEISRAQLWQWARHPGGALPNGQQISLALLDAWIDEAASANPTHVTAPAKQLLTSLIHDDTFVAFLTIPAYDLI